MKEAIIAIGIVVSIFVGIVILRYVAFLLTLIFRK